MLGKLGEEVLLGFILNLVRGGFLSPSVAVYCSVAQVLLNNTRFFPS